MSVKIGEAMKMQSGMEDSNWLYDRDDRPLVSKCLFLYETQNWRRHIHTHADTTRRSLTLCVCVRVKTSTNDNQIRVGWVLLCCCCCYCLFECCGQYNNVIQFDTQLERFILVGCWVFLKIGDDDSSAKCEWQQQIMRERERERARRLMKGGSRQETTH